MSVYMYVCKCSLVSVTGSVGGNRTKKVMRQVLLHTLTHTQVITMVTFVSIKGKTRIKYHLVSNNMFVIVQIPLQCSYLVMHSDR